MLKKAILLLLALYIYNAAHSHTLCTNSLSGQVTEASGNPLIGAAILLTPGGIGQSTDADGRFVFSNICTGTYSVKIQYVGYKDISVKLEVSGTLTRVFRMEEEVKELNEVVIQHHDAANIEHATNFTALNERQLAESAGKKTLGETLKQIPGVTSLQTDPGIFKPVIHGVHSQRLLILNHGIRQEGQQWGAEHAPEIDSFIASNIVVIKDASAIKYGTDGEDPFNGDVSIFDFANAPNGYHLLNVATGFSFKLKSCNTISDSLLRIHSMNAIVTIRIDSDTMLMTWVGM